MGTPSAAFGDGLLPSGARPLRADDPSELGGYRLAGRLGAGGMGVVYLGRDPLDGLVAIKYAHAADEESARRFAAEADVLRRLPEGCTTRLVRDGTARTPPYIITEYVEGRSLAHVVDTGGPLPPEQVRAFATGVLRALAAVHRAGLVHRDLKPPNVLLTVSGPRLIDFGIAQEVGASGGPTGPETVVGSPGWIPPERLRRRPATPASDVFGWGCLAAYAATGRNPYGRGDAEDLAHRILTEPPDLDGVEEPLRDLIAEALAKDPALRPSAADLLARLRGGAPRRRPAETPGTGPRPDTDPNSDTDPGLNADLEPGAVLGLDAGLKPGAVLGVDAALEPGAVLGLDADSEPGAVLRSDVDSEPGAVLGLDVDLEPGAVLGSDADSEPGAALEPLVGSAALVRSAPRRGGHGHRHRRRRRRWPALAAAGAVAAAALTAVIVTKGADHDMAGTPNPGTPLASPTHEDVSAAPTPRPLDVHPRSGLPLVRPHPSSERRTTRPDASQPPGLVPTLIGHPLPTLLKRGTKGRVSGGGRDGGGTGPSGPVDHVG